MTGIRLTILNNSVHLIATKLIRTAWAARNAISTITCFYHVDPVRSKMQDLEKDLGSLRAEINKADSCDKKTASTCLNKLKLAIVQFQLVPPFSEDSRTFKHQLMLARETFELGVLFSVLSKDIHSFWRHLDQVKPYYSDFAYVPSSIIARIHWFAAHSCPHPSGSGPSLASACSACSPTTASPTFTPSSSSSSPQIRTNFIVSREFLVAHC